MPTEAYQYEELDPVWSAPPIGTNPDPDVRDTKNTEKKEQQGEKKAERTDITEVTQKSIDTVNKKIKSILDKPDTDPLAKALRDNPKLAEDLQTFMTNAAADQLTGPLATYNANHFEKGKAHEKLSDTELSAFINTLNANVENIITLGSISELSRVQGDIHSDIESGITHIDLKFQTTEAVSEHLLSISESEKKRLLGAKMGDPQFWEGVGLAALLSAPEMADGLCTMALDVPFLLGTLPQYLSYSVQKSLSFSAAGAKEYEMKINALAQEHPLIGLLRLASGNVNLLPMLQKMMTRSEWTAEGMVKAVSTVAALGGAGLVAIAQKAAEATEAVNIVSTVTEDMVGHVANSNTAEAAAAAAEHGATAAMETGELIENVDTAASVAEHAEHIAAHGAHEAKHAHTPHTSLDLHAANESQHLMTGTGTSYEVPGPSARISKPHTHTEDRITSAAEESPKPTNEAPPKPANDNLPRPLLTEAERLSRIESLTAEYGIDLARYPAFRTAIDDMHDIGSGQLYTKGEHAVGDRVTYDKNDELITRPIRAGTHYDTTYTDVELWQKANKMRSALKDLNAARVETGEPPLTRAQQQGLIRDLTEEGVTGAVTEGGQALSAAEKLQISNAITREGTLLYVARGKFPGDIIQKKVDALRAARIKSAQTAEGYDKNEIATFLKEQYDQLEIKLELRDPEENVTLDTTASASRTPENTPPPSQKVTLDNIGSAVSKGAERAYAELMPLDSGISGVESVRLFTREFSDFNKAMETNMEHIIELGQPELAMRTARTAIDQLKIFTRKVADKEVIVSSESIAALRTMTDVLRTNIENLTRGLRRGIAPTGSTGQKIESFAEDTNLDLAYIDTSEMQIYTHSIDISKKNAPKVTNNVSEHISDIRDVIRRAPLNQAFDLAEKNIENVAQLFERMRLTGTVDRATILEPAQRTLEILGDLARDNRITLPDQANRLKDLGVNVIEMQQELFAYFRESGIDMTTAPQHARIAEQIRQVGEQIRTVVTTARQTIAL